VRRAPSVFPLLLLLLLPALLPSGVPSPPPARADEGEVNVRLIRLLAELPESEQTAPERLHDLKLRLLPGNIVLLRHGSTSAALMPIERTGGSPDSLRYVYYIERPNLFWVIPGSREKGTATVAQGGLVSFDQFRLYWRGDHALGWLCFPAGEEERGLKFSVVSGRTVDQVDPMGTKYWVELGSPERPGF